MQKTLFVALCAAALLAPAAIAATPHTETADYNALGGDLISCSDAVPVEVGGACFDIEADDEKVTVTLADDAEWKVGAYIEFNDADGGFMEYGVLCESGTFSIPAGAASLEVYVDQAFVAIDCPLDGTAGPATTGTITAAFT